MSDDMLALNELTGRVHDYKGTQPGGIASETMDMGIGIIPCGCEGGLFEEAVEADQLTMIKRKHLEAGIWEAAPCVE